MRLLEKKEIEKAKTEELEADKNFGTALAKEVMRLRKELSEFKERKAVEERQINEAFQVMFNGLLERKGNIEKELAVLEERKAEAMKPVEEERAAVEIRARQVQMMAEQANKDKNTAAELNIAADLRESELAARSNQLDRREEAIKEVERKTDIGLSMLKTQHDTYEREKRLIDEERAAITLLEHDLERRINRLKLKEKAVEESREDYEQKHNRLMEKSRVVDDMQSELKRRLKWEEKYG